MVPPDDPRTPRAGAALRVDYRSMNEFFADYARNISKGGAFIKTAQPLAVGTRCTLTLDVPALSEPLVLEGEVAWRLEPAFAAPSEEPGMGIRLLFADEAARQELAELARRMMEDSLGEELARALVDRA